ncbi:MAG: hypothetical protein, partial [Olavius algarvensis Gamma 1 endosymbiont]
ESRRNHERGGPVRLSGGGQTTGGSVFPAPRRGPVRSGRSRLLPL